MTHFDSVPDAADASHMRPSAPRTPVTSTPDHSTPDHSTPDQEVSSEDLSMCLRVLSVATRLDVLIALCAGPKSVQDIAEAVMLDRGHVSVHLGTLLRARLVDQIAEGRRHIYQHSRHVKVRSGTMAVRFSTLRVSVPISACR